MTLVVVGGDGGGEVKRSRSEDPWRIEEPSGDASLSACARRLWALPGEAAGGEDRAEEER